MNDIEFEILDHLYFVITFDELQEATGIDSQELKEQLFGLISRGWAKCLSIKEQQIDIELVEYQQDFKKYHYLATKQGLLAHNSL